MRLHANIHNLYKNMTPPEIIHGMKNGFMDTIRPMTLEEKKAKDKIDNLIRKLKRRADLIRSKGMRENAVYRLETTTDQIEELKNIQDKIGGLKQPIKNITDIGKRYRAAKFIFGDNFIDVPAREKIRFLCNFIFLAWENCHNGHSLCETCYWKEDYLYSDETRSTIYIPTNYWSRWEKVTC